MSDRVPDWVHMADVPPPIDEEPWVRTGNTLCELGTCASCDLLRSLAARRLSGVIAALCLLTATIVCLAVWWQS